MWADSNREPQSQNRHHFTPDDSLFKSKIMVNFAGSYRQTKQENYDDFLKELGLNKMIRKAALAFTPTAEITDLGSGKWKVVTATKVRTMETVFESGKPYDEKLSDGREVTTTITIDGNRWTTLQKDKKGSFNDIHAVREFTDKGFDIQFRCGKAVANCYFEKQ